MTGTVATGGGGVQQPFPHVTSIPTLADRLETYRQMTAGVGGGPSASAGASMLQQQGTAANTIVSQSSLGNYTTSLVERTHDLRNWLKQAKAEHELLNGAGGGSGGGQQTDL